MAINAHVTTATTNIAQHPSDVRSPTILDTDGWVLAWNEDNHVLAVSWNADVPLKSSFALKELWAVGR